MFRVRSSLGRLSWIAGLIFTLASSTVTQRTKQAAEYELAPLVKGLSSPDPAIVRDSAFRLSQLSPAARVLLPAEASTVLQRLTSALGAQYPNDTRQAAAYGLGSITAYLRGRVTPQEREAGLSALSSALDASNPDSLRAAAAWATSKLTKISGTKMSSELRTRFLDELTNLLETKTQGAPGAAAEALGAVFRNAQGITSNGKMPKVATLQSPRADEHVRDYTRQAERAVVSLVSALQTSAKNSSRGQTTNGSLGEPSCSFSTYCGF